MDQTYVVLGSKSFVQTIFIARSKLAYLQIRLTERPQEDLIVLKGKRELAGQLQCLKTLKSWSVTLSHTSDSLETRSLPLLLLQAFSFPASVTGRALG